MKNFRIRDLALRFNYDSPSIFRSEVRAIDRDESLSAEEREFLLALDFAYAKTFDEEPGLTIQDSDIDSLAKGLYALSYFYARNSEDKIAYMVSRLGVDLIAPKCSAENSINLRMLHMMTPAYRTGTIRSRCEEVRVL